LRYVLTTIATLLMLSPCGAQTGSAVRGLSIYSDSVLQLLVRSSQLAADRRQSLLRRSALQANETSLIRRTSSFSEQDRAQLDRLSAFAGDRLRRMEELSEFRPDQITRMKAAFDPRDVVSAGERHLAQQANKNSNMTRDRLLRLLQSSESRDWSRRIRDGAVPMGDFSAILKRRSIASPEWSRQIERLSLDK